MGVTFLLPQLPSAFIFDSASPGEWFVLAVVVMIVVGPKRLPEIARKLGHTMEMFRRAADEFKTQIMTMDQEPAPPQPETTMTSEHQNDPDLSGYQQYPDDATYPGNESITSGNEPEGHTDVIPETPNGEAPATTQPPLSTEPAPAPLEHATLTPSEHAESGRGKE